MSETPKLGLPLVQAAQAQKHVTVNEALARIDALAQLVLKSRVRTTPPAAPAEGDCHAVAAGASGEWAGQTGKLALRLNGGWLYLAPVKGWRAWVEDEGTAVGFNGNEWIAGLLSLSPNGAGATWRVAEIDHIVTAGATNVTATVIPAGVMVFGVTARVITAMSGSATSWQLGHAESVNRYGSGLGVGAGSWVRGMLSQPMTYYSASSLQLTAAGGSFAAGGKLRVAVHYLELAIPSA